MILYIKNIDIEGPGTLGDFLKGRGLGSKIIDCGKGEALPKTLDGVDALVVLGGPMNVYEEKEHPYLREEDRLIKEALSKNVPFLGLCLGSQLLAKASGAKVVKSPEKEIGFFTVDLTASGKKDALFDGLPPKIEVFQWHEDMFEIPEKGELLASSRICPHQALKSGPCAYGLQFHVEITDVSIAEWADEYIQESKRNSAMKTKMLEEYSRKKRTFDRTAQIIYNNFCNIIGSKSKRESLL